VANEFHDFIKQVHGAGTQGKLGEVIFKFVKAEMAQIKTDIDAIKTSIEILGKRDDWLADKVDSIMGQSRELTGQADVEVDAEVIAEPVDEKPKSRRKIKTAQS